MNRIGEKKPEVKSTKKPAVAQAAGEQAAKPEQDVAAVIGDKLDKQGDRFEKALVGLGEQQAAAAKVQAESIGKLAEGLGQVAKVIGDDVAQRREERVEDRQAKERGETIEALRGLGEELNKGFAVDDKMIIHVAESTEGGRQVFPTMVGGKGLRRNFSVHAFTSNHKMAGTYLVACSKEEIESYLTQLSAAKTKLEGEGLYVLVVEK